jgi:uncharacterized membrane protein
MLSNICTFSQRRLGTVVAGFLVSASAVVILQDPAQAELNLCNKTNSQVFTAVGFQENGRWVSSGWWTLDPEECKTVISGNLKNKYYYVHGQTPERNLVWGDSYEYCVTQQPFNSIPKGNCSERSERFFQVDTGDYSSFTQNLTLEGQPPSFPLEGDEVPTNGNAVGLCNSSRRHTVTAIISLAGVRQERELRPETCSYINFGRVTGRARINASSSSGSRWNSSVPVKTRRQFSDYTTFKFN